MKIVITRRVNFGIFPCARITCLKNVVFGGKCRCRHVEAEEKPSKTSKKGGAKGPVALLKESTQLGCVSQESYPRKSVLREPGILGSKHTVKFSTGTWHRIKIRERKGPQRGFIPKCAPHGRHPCAPKFGEVSHEETMHQERCARKAAWDLAKNIYKLKNSDKAAFYVPGEAKVMSAPVASKRPEEREFAVDSGASVHMMSKKELSSGEMDIVKMSRTPTEVWTANGEVHSHEEAQAFVHDLNQFVTVQLLEETPAAVSPGKLCKDHGYSNE